ncbi:MAG: ATP-binding protein [Gemmatimonadota bacterium]
MSQEPVNPRPRDPAPADPLSTLRARLDDSQETVRAIRLGEVDALVMESPDGPRVYTLVSADESYRTLVEQMAEAALILDESGLILYSNARLSAILARPHRSLAGHCLTDLALAEDRPALVKLLAEAAGGEAAAEIRFLGEADEAVPIRISASPLRSPGFAGLAVVATDLSEQKRRERAAERERLTEAVLQFASTGILVCDSRGTVIRANLEARTFCGGDVVGRPFEAAVPGGMTFPELAAGGGESPQPLTLRTGGGDDRIVLVGARRIGEAPDSGWWVVTLADVTAREQLIVAEQEARVAAERASRVKTEFLSVMSHELRTPLNAVLGYADLLLMGMSGTLGEDQHRQVERVRASALHQLSLVNDILTFARAEGNRDNIRLGTVDVEALLREVELFVRPEVERKHIEIRLELAEDRPLLVDTDPDKLRKILLNLVANAANFTRQGRITISAGWQEERLVVGVRDTGPGIPEDRLPEIWEPFTQLDASLTRESGGIGLGLAIVRQLTEVIGAGVTVESPPEGGTVFTLDLPRRLRTGEVAEPKG